MSVILLPRRRSELSFCFSSLKRVKVNPVPKQQELFNELVHAQHSHNHTGKDVGCHTARHDYLFLYRVRKCEHHDTPTEHS